MKQNSTQKVTLRNSRYKTCLKGIPTRTADFSFFRKHYCFTESFISQISDFKRGLNDFKQTDADMT